MKKFLIGFGILGVGGAGAFGIVAAQYVEKIKPNTFVGIVPVGDLTRDEAKKKLRLWWETEKLTEIELGIPMSNGKSVKGTPGKFGVTIDDELSIQSLPLDSFWDSTQRSIGASQAERKKYDIKFKSNGQDANWVNTIVKQSVGSPRAAKIKFVGGKLVKEYEVPSYSVDAEKLHAQIELAMTGSQSEIPIKMAEKAITDDVLDKVDGVVSEFSTSFPASQSSRNANLRIASSKIDGHLMMPGDIFSFNEVVGKRTLEDGYRLAPVLASGRHDIGVGGGICQVSGTLYNSVLLADLKIVKRQNHSMPVAYLPVGRDATVSFPSLDFKFQNNTGGPIAISSTFVPGRLTFRILGQKVPGRKVSIQTAGHRSWGNSVQYVNDSSLAPGRQVVVERGSSGHAIATYRVVVVNGKEVKRELIDRSHYPGGKRIVHINRSAPKAKPSAAPAAGPGTPPPGSPESDNPDIVPPPAP